MEAVCLALMSFKFDNNTLSLTFISPPLPSSPLPPSLPLLSPSLPLFSPSPLSSPLLWIKHSLQELKLKVRILTYTMSDVRHFKREIHHNQLSCSPDICLEKNLRGEREGERKREGEFCNQNRKTKLMSIKKEDNTCIGQRSNEGRDKKGHHQTRKSQGMMT